MTRQPEAIQHWSAFAREDLLSAKVLLKEKIYNQACFHSQQCVEKLFKALLLSKDTFVPRIHDLKELFRKCIEAGFVELLIHKEKVEVLSLFYAPTRYPDAVIGSLPDRLPNENDAKEAVETAEVVIKQVDKWVR